MFDYTAAVSKLTSPSSINLPIKSPAHVFAAAAVHTDVNILCSGASYQNISL